MIRSKIIFCIMLLLPLNVYAEANFNASCTPTTAKPNEMIACTLSAVTDYETAKIVIPFTIGSGLTVETFIIDTRLKAIYTGYEDGGTEINIITNENRIPAGSHNIGTLLINVNSDAVSGTSNITFNGVVFNESADNVSFIPHSMPSASVAIKVNVPSTNNNQESSSTEKPSTTNENNKTTTSGEQTQTTEKKEDNEKDKKEDTKNEEKVEKIKTGEKEKKTSTEVGLLDIQIDGYKIDFNKETYEYSLKIKNEKELKIKPLFEDEDTSYEIIGNSNLENGSIIDIMVESNNQDEEIVTYRINIIKEEEIKQSMPTGFIAIIIILITINLLRIIRRIKNNKKARK